MNTDTRMKIVAIVEVVLQACRLIVVVVLIGLAIFATRMMADAMGQIKFPGLFGNFTITDETGKTKIIEFKGGAKNEKELQESAKVGTATIAAIALLPVIIYCIAVSLLDSFLAYVVWSGYQQKNAGRLDFWFIFQCIYTSLGLIRYILFLFFPLPWYWYLLDTLFYIYKVCAIYIARVYSKSLVVHQVAKDTTTVSNG